MNGGTSVIAAIIDWFSKAIPSWQRGFIKDEHVQQIYQDGKFQSEYQSAGQVRSLGAFHIKLDPRMMGGELVSRGLEKAMFNKEDTWMLGTWCYKNHEPQPLWLTATILGHTLVRPFNAKAFLAPEGP